MLFGLVVPFAEPIFRQDVVDVGFQLSVKLTWVLGILLITRLGISLVSRITRRVLNRLEPTLRKFLVQASETLVLVVGIIAILDALGIQVATLVAVIGAAGLAIGLALQGTLSHFAAGVMLIVLRPFEVGDTIEAAGVIGTVDAIGVFSTTIWTADYVEVVVPNNNLFSSTIKNSTSLGTRRVDLEIDIGDHDITSTSKLLLGIAQHHPLVLEMPPPTCHVASITTTTTVVYLRPWCKSQDYSQVRSDLQQRARETLIVKTPT